jgi:FMN phosphatase YigB (HAD superfamily)
VDRPVDAALFDLSEVCLRGLKGTSEYIQEALGLPVAPHALLGADATRLFHAEITEEEYWQALIVANGWGADVAALMTIVRRNFRRIAGTEPIIRALKESGYRLGLLSVHAREWVDSANKRLATTTSWMWLSTHNSYEHRVSKPEPRAYQLALAALGSSASRTLFIDDSQVNIRAAADLGFQTIHFATAEQLRFDLLNMRVLLSPPEG